jgi:hypothetical protein
MSRDYRPGTEYESQDGIYWEQNGFFDKTYAPQVPLPIHKKMFGNIFYLLARAISGHTIVTYKK